MGTPSIDTTSHDAVITTDNTPTEIAALVGATTTENRRDAGASTWGATAIASGNDLLVQVTGQVGKTIAWEILEDSVR